MKESDSPICNDTVYTQVDIDRVVKITVDKTINWLLKYGYCDADVYTELDRRELLKDIEG